MVFQLNSTLVGAEDVTESYFGTNRRIVETERKIGWNSNVNSAGGGLLTN